MILRDGVDVTNEVTQKVKRLSGENTIEREAQGIIEYIWSIWYGHHRGNMNSDQMSDLLTEAKRKIILLAETSGEPGE